MVFRPVQRMRLGPVPAVDVHDGAAWTAPVPLSHASIRAHGMPQEIPDFTRELRERARGGVGSEKP